MAGRVKRVIHRPRPHGSGEGAWVKTSILPVKPQGLTGVQKVIQEPVTPGFPDSLVWRFPPLTSQTPLPASIEASTQSCPAMLSASPELLTSALYVECLHCSPLNKPIQFSAELSSLKGLVSWVQSQCLATWVASRGNPRQHIILDRLFLRNNSGTSLVVQWLELCTSTAGGTGLMPGWGTEIPHATWCSRKEIHIP